jgi:Ca2+/Na+ antiporter
MAFGFNLLLSSFGAVVGLIYGGIAANHHLRTVEKKGEFTASRRTWVFILLAIIVVVLPMLYFAFSFGLAGIKLMMSFMYPFVPAVYVTMTGIYLNWERTQKKLVWLEGTWIGRLYASQKPEKK